jgi:hypothetical protein
MEGTEAINIQRVATGRREVTWRTVFYGFTRSRRHNLRRDADADVILLDWQHPWLFFLAVSTMLMSCLDAFMTLQLLDRGMVEANPVMAALLGYGTRAFAIVKVSMTGTGILILVFLAKLRFLNRFRTGLFLTVAFAIYACLICYEFVYLIADM